MLKVASLPTEFAPAEREDVETISLQISHFAGSPLLQHLLDTTPNIFLILNEYRQIVFANHAMHNLLKPEEVDSLYGQRPGEALNCTHAYESLGGCGTTEFCRTCGAVQAALTSLRGHEAVEECRIIQKNGNSLDLRIVATPLIVDNAVFTTFAITDISHEKRRRVLERIFFHDVLNTAGGVLGCATLLRGASSEELEDLQEDIFSVADLLVTEIKSQQILAAAENGELTVGLADVDTLDITRQVVNLYKSHELAALRQVQIAESAQAVRFSTDPALLRRVLSNMVKNALEASHPGQTVTINCGTDSGQAWFSVHNSIAMSRAVELQIFQRSFSTKGSGRGLGTYSMKLLSERYLQGQISFTTSPEQGTTFVARYPLTMS